MKKVLNLTLDSGVSLMRLCNHQIALLLFETINGGDMAHQAAEEIKKIIFEKIGERDELKKRVNKLDSEINKLNASLKILTGEDLLKKSGDKPVLDYVEDLLMKYEKLHVDEMVAMLWAQYGIEAPKQSVAAGLIRYHNQGKRFERVARNTFALRQKEEEK